MSEAQAVREERPVTVPDLAAEVAMLRADNALLRGVIAKALAVMTRSRGGTVAAVKRILEGAPLR